MLFSPQMASHCKLLERFFNERGVKTAIYPVDAFDFEGVLGICDKILERFADAELTLNVTGGTKIAALAAWQQCWFSSRFIRIIYIDTGGNRLLELGDSPVSRPLPDNILSVKDHLLCCGKKMLAGCAPQGETLRRQVTAELCHTLINNLDLLRRLNAVVAGYLKQMKKKAAGYCAIRPAELGSGGQKICTLLLEAGVATEGLDKSVNLNSEKECFYACGGWLEEYVYGVIAAEEITGLDLQMNVEIEWQRAGKNYPTTNELDVVFSWRNRLHVISCKTSALDQRGKYIQKGKGPLYELDSLAEKMGGRYVRSMLLSAHYLGEASLERAANLGIEIIAGRDILSLSQHLKQRWLKQEP